MRFRSIQVLRGVAACAVLIHHAYRLVDPDAPTRLGAVGVDLFFVISGFIMATVAADKAPPRFLADRAWRIFPLWFVAVTPWLIFKHNSAATVAASLTLWPIYSTAAFTKPALGVGWSLCFEMLFYAAFALALATKARIPLIIYAACLCLSFTSIALFRFTGSPLILEFLAGVLVARLPVAPRLGLPIIGAAVIAFAFAPTDHYFLVVGGETMIRSALWGIPAALLVYGARSAEKLFCRDLFDLPVFLGDASYSIYLFHTLVLLAPVPWPLGIAAALIVGCFIHRFIERPLIDLRTVLHQRHAAAA